MPTTTATAEVIDIGSTVTTRHAHGTSLAMLGIVKRELDRDGSVTGRVIDIRRGMTTADGETIDRVEIRWTGIDSSGHFAEYRDAFARLSDCAPA